MGNKVEKRAIDSPLFSVLVPCYNAERFLEECVDSVLEQSCSNWELILVDDGSIDSTYELMEAIALRNPGKIIIQHTENRGQLPARQLAVSLASGCYLVFLDSDDMLGADALSEFERALQVDPEAVIQYKYSRDRFFAEPLYPEFELGCGTIKRVDVSWLRKRVCQGNHYNNLCGKVFPRMLFLSKYREVASFPAMRNGEDLLQLLPILDVIEHVILLDEPLYYYRPVSSSVTKSFNPAYYESVRKVSVELRKRAGFWADGPYKEEIDKRWLVSLRRAIIHLSKSGYKLNKIKELLQSYASDSLFIESWASGSKSLDLKSRLVFFLLRKRTIGMLALLLKVWKA